MAYRSLLLAATLCLAIGSTAQATGLCPTCGNAATGKFYGVNFQYWAAHYNTATLLSSQGYAHPDIHKFGGGATPSHASFGAARGGRMGR